jgi:carboxyl-terminal processing protease
LVFLAERRSLYNVTGQGTTQSSLLDGIGMEKSLMGFGYQSGRLQPSLHAGPEGRRWNWLASLSWLILMAVPLWIADPAAAQRLDRSRFSDLLSADARDPNEIANRLLKDGEALERSRQWGEALSVYQQAIKLCPSNPRLKQRRAVARIHFDFERRYADASFVSSIDSTDVHTAFETYAEVLSKIQLYYVDEPDWADLASYGLTSLEVALMSPDFRRRYIPQAGEQQIRTAILETREKLAQVTVTSPQDCNQVVRNTARWMQDSLKLSLQATTYEFICGAISALDPYSSFMSKNQFGETMSQIEGNFVGLGVELRTHHDHLEIVSVIPEGSADRGGIVRGDRIMAVDRQPVVDIGSERAADMLRGPEFSYVEVTLDRGKASNDLRLQRLRVEIPSVDSIEMVDVPGGIGYIRIANFQKTTPRDFDNGLWKLHRQGMQALIIDLRGNPGGLLKAAVDIADRFVQNGVIVSTKGRNPMEDFTHRASPTTTWRIPLVVLVDENSASASEIFAAAIRDHQRGLIVGETTYGKGSVQGIFPLTTAGGVRLTTAKFYSPKGNPIAEIGVPVDQTVAAAEEDRQHLRSSLNPGEDQPLAAAIHAARQMIQSNFNQPNSNQLNGSQPIRTGGPR